MSALPELTLAQLPERVPVRVRSLTGGGLLRERLVELGFVPGVRVEVLRRAVLGGPLQASVLGGTIALRRDEADCVRVDAMPRPVDVRPAAAPVAAGVPA